MEIEEIIGTLIKEPLAKISIKLDTVSFCKEGNANVLRITIDKEPYIDVDDCVAATKVINPIIDAEVTINGAYILDVCSKEKGGDK